MIGLSAPTSDTAGCIVLDDKKRSRLYPPTARLSRSKCLDATSHVEHSGVVEGDRSLSLIIPNISEPQYSTVKYLHKNYATVTVACCEGVFSGAIEQPYVSGGTCYIRIMVSERLDE